MPRSFEVSSSTGSYTVSVGAGVLEQAAREHPQALYVVDERLIGSLPAGVSDPIVVEAVESNKSLEHAPEIIIALRSRGANRTTHLIVVGGGIIQDVATFAASIFMRGIAWTYLPTTLLGMVDSCIGGKSSINVTGYKNLVGNFYPPEAVMIDPAFTQTLDAEMIVGGLFEAAKICYARSYDDFLDYLSQGPDSPIRLDAVERVILKSLQTKQWFIEIDEHDNKERLLLNFGHTFGHALEAATDFGVSHGMAVGVGMLIACEFARAGTLLSATGLSRTDHLCAHVHDLLGKVAASGQFEPPLVDLASVLDKFEHDKKHRPDGYRVVLPRGDGALDLMTESRTGATRQALASAYESVITALGWPTQSGHEGEGRAAKRA